MSFYYPNNNSSNDEDIIRNLNLRVQYPVSDTYDYQVRLKRVNLDKEREHSLMTGKGMIISKKQNIKKDLKSEKSIFAPTFFGPTMNDANAFANRTRCKCGHYKGVIWKGYVCEYCKDEVKYYGDDFEKFGWICLDEQYCLIHPNLYKALASFIGKDFEAMLDTDDKLDENGMIIEQKPSKSSPFVGIGILDFRDRFDEIMEFYRNKNKSKPEKLEYFNDIMEWRQCVFTHSIPVFTTQLRPFSIDDTQFSFDGNNSRYNILAAQAERVNKNALVRRLKGKPVKQILFRMQQKWMEIYEDLEKQLAHKKGFVRSAIGGRYNFCSRSVIVPDSKLEIDEVILPYKTMVVLFEQRIINILSKTMPVSQAYMKWFYATIEPDREIYDLMMDIVRSEYVGIFLNRNPSIWSLSILQMRVVGIHFQSHGTSLPLEILSGLNADFDGDTLNYMYIINDELLRAAMQVFNPKYTGQISRCTGLFETNVSHQTNTMICLNSFVRLAYDDYTEADFAAIEDCQHTA